MVERDPERGRAVAAALKALGVKGILIKAAEQGQHHAARMQHAAVLLPRGAWRRVLLRAGRPER